MGYSTWSDDAFDYLKDSRAGASADDIFANNRAGRASNKMLPYGVKFRESRDSDIHPESLAIGVFLDETGSMGRIPEILVREKLGALMNTLIDHGVPHPQILFGGIGDHHSDQFPLQVGQFESGTAELDQWLTEIFLEGNGGGQNRESYTLAWLFAARHTSCDCFEKRGQKGFLFTIGDEAAWDVLQGKALQAIMGYPEAQDLSDKQLLEEAQRSYHVFHIHVNEGSYRDDKNVLGYWKKILGERLIVLNDYNAIAETIASAVALVHGVELQDILNCFDKGIASSVENALVHVKQGLTTTPKKSGGFLGGIFKL
ncbi:hypothetical protein Q5H93_08970 [Hymenobacter sp. ASUV-10]|uniref:VWA domain-containing protein n=1 Tax=Hymenobacter aranciens TaxID=3063996 RepID=A0ABT9B9B6_9BACT|nr:hypothetical protein [Hymenobacter sp. ASUV-10]MDO7874860.1 hypothetical protein [Hymenobacter sp. ASUV-10]